jgi:uncharacterized protein YdaU (DUF1376 family)
MKDAPAFDLYPERWTHGTRHMSKIERCDYMDLMCHQWTDDGLPADLDILARLVGYKKGSQIPALVLEKFPVANDGKRRNNRLEAEREKQRERIASKAKGAAITNAKRWGKPVANESHSDDSATPQRVALDSPPPTTHPHPVLSPDGERGAGETSAVADAPAAANPKQSRKALPIDDSYLDSLKSTYPYANVRQEFAKSQRWCEAQSPPVTLSRQRLVNWLNRIPPPPSVNGTEKDTKPKSFFEGYERQ